MKDKFDKIFSDNIKILSKNKEIVTEVQKIVITAIN